METNKTLIEVQEQLDEAVKVANMICGDMEELGVGVGVGVMAMGIGFATGAASIGMPLPVAIELLASFYKQANVSSKAH